MERDVAGGFDVTNEPSGGILGMREAKRAAWTTTISSSGSGLAQGLVRT